SLCHFVVKAWLIAWPLAFPGSIIVIKYWKEGSPYVWFRARIRLAFGCLWGCVRPRYRRYSRAADEDKYWRSGERVQRALQASNANTVPPTVPLVRYYVPRLPPPCRESLGVDHEGTEYHLSSRTFCKWHRMVFRGPMHPTPREASQQIRYYSNRDRRQIYRISRLLTDEEVFHRGVPWTPRYATMWKQWLNTKGPDIAIVFK
ncbi:hypothetical protein C2E23DRAFT_728789, partial [Lenzites betulinus]